MNERHWLLLEIEQAAEEFRQLPDWLKPSLPHTDVAAPASDTPVGVV